MKRIKSILAKCNDKLKQLVIQADRYWRSKLLKRAIQKKVTKILKQSTAKEELRDEIMKILKEKE